MKKIIAKPQTTVNTIKEQVQRTFHFKECLRVLTENETVFGKKALRIIPVGDGKNSLWKKFLNRKHWGVAVDNVKTVLSVTGAKNIAVECGDYGNRGRKLVVIDIDNVAGRNKTPEEILRLLNCKTFIVSTPSGGYHVYFYTIETIKCGPVAYGVDVKSTGGYVLAPGSTTTAGHYSLAIEHDLYEETICLLPRRWRERLSVLSGKVSVEATISMPRMQPFSRGFLFDAPVADLYSAYRNNTLRVEVGSRNAVLCRLAGWLVFRTNGLEDLCFNLMDIRDKSFDSPNTVSNKEIRTVAKYVIEKERKKSEGFLPQRKAVVNISGKLASSDKVDYLAQKVLKQLKRGYVKTATVKTSSLREVANLYQTYLEKNGVKFNKTISMNAVAELLKRAGITTKRTRSANYWELCLRVLKRAIKAANNKIKKLHCLDAANSKPTVSIIPKNSSGTLTNVPLSHTENITSGLHSYKNSSTLLSVFGYRLKPQSFKNIKYSALKDDSKT